MSRWPVAGPSEYWLLASSPASKVKTNQLIIKIIIMPSYLSVCTVFNYWAARVLKVYLYCIKTRNMLKLASSYWKVQIRSVVYDIFVNCSWGSHPLAVVQYTFTHKQYTERHKTNNTWNNTTVWKSAGRAPSLRVLPWHLPYNWGKSTEKPQSE